MKVGFPEEKGGGTTLKAIHLTSSPTVNEYSTTTEDSTVTIQPEAAYVRNTTSDLKGGTLGILPFLLFRMFTYL